MLRRTRREIVEGERPSLRTISRILTSWACQSSISSRSANERYRPVGVVVTWGFTPPA